MVHANRLNKKYSEGRSGKGILMASEEYSSTLHDVLHSLNGKCYSFLIWVFRVSRSEIFFDVVFLRVS